MVCKPVVFSGITRERFQAIRARIRAQAEVEVLGDTGTATKSGFKISWTYLESAQSLTLVCVEKPWIVSEGIVAAKLRDLVEAL